MAGAGGGGAGSGLVSSFFAHVLALSDANVLSRQRRAAAAVSAPVAAQSARAIEKPSRLATDPQKVEPSACAPKNATWHTPSARARAQAGEVICATAPNVVPAASHAAPNSTTAKAASTQCRETLSRAIAAYASSEATSTSLPGESRSRNT